MAPATKIGSPPRSGGLPRPAPCRWPWKRDKVRSRLRLQEQVVQPEQVVLGRGRGIGAGDLDREDVRSLPELERPQVHRPGMDHAIVEEVDGLAGRLAVDRELVDP